MSNHLIRPTQEKDIADILRLVKELAEFGGDLADVTATEADLYNVFFAPIPSAEALVAEVDGQIVGYAVFFKINSTYSGRQGLFLEDLYVTPDHRAKGIGRALFVDVVRIGHEGGYVKVDWKAYDWNTEAIRFYFSLGAVALDTQTYYRLKPEAMAKLAQK